MLSELANGPFKFFFIVPLFISKQFDNQKGLANCKTDRGSRRAKKKSFGSEQVDILLLYIIAWRELLDCNLYTPI